MSQEALIWSVKLIPCSVDPGPRTVLKSVNPVFEDGDIDIATEHDSSPDFSPVRKSVCGSTDEPYPVPVPAPVPASVSAASSASSN